mmetsp:Transcript_49012/g.104349  ORF Transcript_49012/g.104349 Transcript_49012/m.104349 type:complete len:428 (-) Transcript_49012:8-1291(-)
MLIVPRSDKTRTHHEPKWVSVHSSATGLRQFMDLATPAKLPLRKLQGKSGPKRLLELALISNVPATAPLSHKKSPPSSTNTPTPRSEAAPQVLAPGPISQSFPIGPDAPLHSKVGEVARTLVVEDIPTPPGIESIEIPTRHGNFQGTFVSSSPAMCAHPPTLHPSLTGKMSPTSQKKPPGSWQNSNQFTCESEQTTQSWPPSLDSMQLFSIAETSSSGDSERDEDLGRSCGTFETSGHREATSNDETSDDGSNNMSEKSSSNSNSSSNISSNSSMKVGGPVGDISLTLVRTRPEESMCGAEWTLPVKEVISQNSLKMESASFDIIVEFFGELRFKMLMENNRIGLQCLSVQSERRRASLSFVVSIGPTSSQSVLPLSSFTFRPMRSTWWGSFQLDAEKLQQTNPLEAFSVRILVQDAIPASTMAQNF